jgi:hypothetical protein
MTVYPVYYNDGSGEGDEHRATFDSPEAAKKYISQQCPSFHYDWYSETVLSLADIKDDDEDKDEFWDEPGWG